MKRKALIIAALLAASLSSCAPRAGFATDRKASIPPGAGTGAGAAFLEEAGLDPGTEVLRLEPPGVPESRRPVAPSTGEVVEIREKLFIAQVNDVYLNPEEYLGKTIKLEGLFKTETGYGASSYRFVIRYGPGCCGNDGNAGFEVAWEDGGRNYPGEDAWVEAVGVLSRYEEEGFPYLYLALLDLSEKEARGAEFVSQ